MYRRIARVGGVGAVDEQAATVDSIELVGLAAKVARHTNGGLLFKDGVDFVLAKHVEHVGNPLSRAGAVPAHRLWVECDQVFFPQQTVNQRIGVGLQQLGWFPGVEKMGAVIPGLVWRAFRYCAVTVRIGSGVAAGSGQATQQQASTTMNVCSKA